MSDRIVWRTAEPLWRRVDRDRFEQPAVLRFAGDDFMDQFADAVAGSGAGLAPFVVGRETWQQPGAGLGTAHEVAATVPVTLFQPTHGRFYLATASLVCRRYGHPDHRVDAAADEQVGFLLRRLEPTGPDEVDVTDPTTFHELGRGVDGAWRTASAVVVTPDEARLPLFPVTAASGPGDRRVFAGLVPASGREALEAGPIGMTPADVADSDDPLAAVADERLSHLQPLVAALQQIRAPEPSISTALLRESLFYTMVDLADWIVTHLGPLGSVTLPRLGAAFTLSLDWRQALAAARAAEPTASFAAGAPVPAPVAGLGRSTLREAAAQLLFGRSRDHAADDATPPTATALFVAAAAELPPASPGASAAADEPAATGAAPPTVATSSRAVYAVRFLYERPQCRPADRQELSRLSRPFRLARFHDPDAPARPVRIAMPIDTSPGALRKFPKNVSVVLSAELRKQMQRVGPDTLDGDVAAEQPVGFGMLCQLSIPIISICALILLMIIVQLLNLVFFWVPLFKICLPVPRSEG